MWDNAKSNRQYWQAGLWTGIAGMNISSVFFNRQRWAWEEEEK